jgi:nucleoside-diphosphate-sugar epimerase
VRTVVTGATGYIGGRLLAAMLERGWDTCAVVHSADDSALAPGVLRVPDTGRAPDLATALAAFGPDAVMHLAAAQDLTDDPSASDALVEANLAFGARVLAASRAAGARAFVAAGTYSAHATGVYEYVPQTLYAATKRALLALMEHYRVNTPLATVMLELSDTYGPGDGRPKFINLIAEAAASGESLHASPGDQVVRPIHADDIVAAFIHSAILLLDGAEVGAVHSVAGPDAVTLRELVDVFERATGGRVPVEWGARPHRPNEIMNPWSGDPLPAWEAGIGLLEGLGAVYGHLKPQERR